MGNHEKNGMHGFFGGILKFLAELASQLINFELKEFFPFFVRFEVRYVLIDPSRIFNADKSGLLPCPKTGKVLGSRCYKIVSC